MKPCLPLLFALSLSACGPFQIVKKTPAVSGTDTHGIMQVKVTGEVQQDLTFTDHLGEGITQGARESVLCSYSPDLRLKPLSIRGVTRFDTPEQTDFSISLQKYAGEAMTGAVFDGATDDQAMPFSAQFGVDEATSYWFSTGSVTGEGAPAVPVPASTCTLNLAITGTRMKGDVVCKDLRRNAHSSDEPLGLVAVEAHFDCWAP